MWEVEKEGFSKELRGHGEGVYTLCFSPDNLFLVSGSLDKTIKFWSVSTGIVIRTILEHNNLVKSLKFTADGRFLFSGSWDNTIKKWTRSENYKYETVVSKSGTYVLVDLGVKGVGLWKNSGKPLNIFKLASESKADFFEFSFDEKMVVCGFSNENLAIWEIETGELLRKYDSYKELLFVSFSVSNQYIIIGKTNKTILLLKKVEDEQGHYFESLDEFLKFSYQDPELLHSLDNAIFFHFNSNYFCSYILATKETWLSSKNMIIFNNHKSYSEKSVGVFIEKGAIELKP